MYQGSWTKTQYTKSWSYVYILAPTTKERKFEHMASER